MDKLLEIFKKNVCRKNFDIEEHKIIALWAADCAEHVISAFEKHYDDDRPRKAIDAVRLWVNGEMKVAEVRKFAFASHVAAREIGNKEAIAAARSSGHAAATAHVIKHALYASTYALKAVIEKEKELNWQMNKLPEKFRNIIER